MIAANKKQQYYGKQLVINDHNLKEMWKIMKEIIGIPQKMQTITKKKNGKEIANKDEIADMFNDLVCSYRAPTSLNNTLY